MTPRLRDLGSPKGSPEAELADLVAAMEPIEPTAVRQHRVLQAVTARVRDRGWTLAALLRPVLAASIFFGAGVAAAAATVGHDWVARRWHELTASASPLPPAPAATAPVRPRPAAHPTEVAPVVAVEPTPSPGAPAPTRAPARAAVRRAPKGEDPSALVEAVRALRADHDASRAARLLDGYLRSYPRGALAEEARALQIEAAVALHSPRAAAFADQYLRMYPNGRFCQVARQTLAARP